MSGAWDNDNPFATSGGSGKTPLLNPSDAAHLAGGAYNAMPDEGKAAVQAAVLEEGKKQAAAVGGSEYGKLKGWITGGPLSLRVLCFLSGLSCAVCSGFAAIAELTSINLFNMIVQFYIIAFSLLIAGLEMKGMLCSATIRRWLDTEFHFLSSLWSRGFFYFFIGSIQLGQWWSGLGGLFTLLPGIALLFCAVLAWIVGAATGKQLKELKRKMASSGGDIKARFDMYDHDKDGAIDTKEFLALCASFEINLNSNQLEAAMNTLDREDTGKIPYTKFVQWWGES